MAIDHHTDMTINGHLVANVSWAWGTMYPAERRWQEGWGTSIETPAVLEILDMVALGQASAGEVRAALAQTGEKLCATHDRDYGDPDSEALARCYGDCQRCQDREPEVRRTIEARAERSRNLLKPEYQYVICGRLAHSSECRHVSDLRRHAEPVPDYEFRFLLHEVVHDECSLDDSFEPVTYDGLLRWCQANTGPQGGRYYRSCKTCNVQFP
ncbi:hypothetical protein [Streptomyces sp. CT34]|uniref:hypothetical protein n=1 Tax=Streptomyces sp. CT34 TaxID=1553907 RepID=UPI0005B8E71C|nr:hypothetical protein [Streptomyces sp. CT34]